MGTNFAVGRTVKVIDDINRTEIFEEGPKHRTFPVSIFYPIEKTAPNKNKSNLTNLFTPTGDVIIADFVKVGIKEEKLKEIIISIYNNLIYIC
ncbi:hypothetical protein [Bacillus sp. FJAT-49736]|uniref:hypothetical protein n=1 Tax=Bacillus sp. FJAT-49736 TaxID=2833582 RepID=UPI001BC9C0E6|nr:hypothetical protein [Bacillus sp. FJAT-49736]MBS4172712.1 hypothetical protein [Bacillus sp. FJAT-49736]